MGEAGMHPAGVAAGSMPGGGDDAPLISRSLGTPERFAAIFDRHAAAIHSYVTRRLGRDRADDVVAEVFLVAFQRRGEYDLTHADARPWLYGIATNLIRRHRRNEVRFLRAIAQAAEDPPAEPIADQVTRRVAAQAVRGALARVLAELPGPQRDVLLLVASGLSVTDTAAPTRTACSAASPASPGDACPPGPEPAPPVAPAPFLGLALPSKTQASPMGNRRAQP
jgi:RNA polymerase sigma factor (sigma-70 family)